MTVVKADNWLSFRAVSFGWVLCILCFHRKSGPAILASGFKQFIVLTFPSFNFVLISV